LHWHLAHHCVRELPGSFPEVPFTGDVVAVEN